MSYEKKINLYVLTGFLGAGKTTMLLGLIDKMKGRKIGIIQNEFGKLSIDGDILRSGDIEMKEISRGSIFCSCLKLNFVSALAEMGDMDIDCLFVESSGLADPSNLEEILGAVEVMKSGQPYKLMGVICLVDGVDFLNNAEDLETVQRQVVHCNIALINKRDLISDERAEEIKAAIRKLNSTCMILETKYGEIDPQLFDKDLSEYSWAACEDTTNTVETKPKTFSIQFEGPVEREKLITFLKSVLGNSYRIKGFAKLDSGWSQVDVVGSRIDIKPCEAKELSQIVFISKVGIQLIREINDNWNDIVKLPVKLKN
ncbi:MAG: GTP-binding protein [Clostridiaceae bacterium]|nr:GTP-binding protein [Clostridiaceae bacterium]